MTATFLSAYVHLHRVNAYHTVTSSKWHTAAGTLASVTVGFPTDGRSPSRCQRCLDRQAGWQWTPYLVHRLPVLEKETNSVWCFPSFARWLMCAQTAGSGSLWPDTNSCNSCRSFGPKGRWQPSPNLFPQNIWLKPPRLLWRLQACWHPHLLWCHRPSWGLRITCHQLQTSPLRWGLPVMMLQRLL